MCMCVVNECISLSVCPTVGLYLYVRVFVSHTISYLLVYYFCFILVGFLLYSPACFLKRERKKLWSWKGREVRIIKEEQGQENNDQIRFHENKLNKKDQSSASQTDKKPQVAFLLRPPGDT